MTTKWTDMGLRHTCPDGQRPRLQRDASVPVGQTAPIRCPRCDYRSHGAQVEADVARILGVVR